eukprot:c23421_g1_i1 orf=173-4678(-)
MSTNKLLQSLSEDPQLEKQIGCMTGILQLFDRHQVLTGKRLYGHKRISAAPKTQTSTASNCGSPASDTSGPMNETRLRHPTEDEKQKYAPAEGVAASPEQRKSQPLPTPPTLTDAKGSSAYARTPPLPLNEMSMQGSGRDQLPKVSFEMARSSILAPRRLDSSRSLHEARVNVSQEGKVFARRSVDTAERAAAAARGALKELSRITADFTAPSDHGDEVSIRDIVRSSIGQEQYTPKPSANPSLSSSSTSAHTTTFAPRMANDASIYTPKPGLAKDVPRSRYIEAKSSAECNSADRSTQCSNTFGRVEAPRPPRYQKPKSEAPTKSCADISESLRLLAKLREAAPAYNSLLSGNVNADNVGNKVQSAANHVPQQARSPLDLAKEGPAFAPRVSLPRVSDQIPGRLSSYEPSRSSCVDSLVQGGPKAREIPRLSLDGRGSGPGFKGDREAGSRGNLLSRSLLNSRSVSCSNSDCDTESLHEKRTSFSSNVVAKLMGLDEMPDGEPTQAAKLQPRLNLPGSADQKALRMSNVAMQDAKPTFSQCGKYVSASFFPSKRRDDIKIAMDPEDPEEESYLQLESLSHQEARTLNVRVGSLKVQAGDRLVATESANSLGHPCYQPKNHHLMEDRPPHVLSPAARLCAQIEEMQRADSLYKEAMEYRGSRTMELQQSSKAQDLEALKQLLGAIHLNKDYSHGAGSRVEKLEERATPRKPQPESGRAPYLHEQRTHQAEQPLAVIWKTKRMLTDELDAQTHEHNPNSRRVPVESHNRRVKNVMDDADSLPSSRQYALPENYNHVPRSRVDVRSSPAAMSHPSTYSTPRKTTISNDCITPTNSSTSNMAGARRLVARTHSPPNLRPARFSTSPQTPPSQQLRQSNNSSFSWEASSVSSTSSSNVRDQHLMTNSSYHAADKKNKQCAKGALKKKSGSGILKDKEECKANLVISLKPSQNTATDKKTSLGGGLAEARTNARTARRSTPQQSAEHLRSRVRSPTKSSARKAEEVRRKLNFVSHTAGGVRPLEMANEDEDAQYVDKSMVSSINNKDPSKNYAPMHQSSNASEPGHDVMPEEPFSSSNSHGNQLALSTNTFDITHFESTEVGVKSSLLLLPRADAEGNHIRHLEQHVPATIFTRDPREPITADGGSPTAAICTSAGALKLPQVPQRENEDTESQGDKSTGSCEQPSPISVLDGPFYEEDVSSPPTPTKFVLKLEELEDEARGKDVSGEASAGGSPQLFRCGLPQLGQDVNVQDFEYVKQLLEIAGSPMDNDDGSCKKGMWRLRPLEPHCFLQLEEENASSHGSASAFKNELGIESMWRRRLLFDAVNTSLERRLCQWRLCQRQPWLLACERGLRTIMAGDCSLALQQGIIGLDEENNVCLSREGGEVLLGELWQEIGEMQRGKRRKTKGSTNAERGEEEEEEREAEEGACDDVGRLLEEDICGCLPHSRNPGTWPALNVGKGELGLDLERLIFKDLIDQTIRDLGLLIYPPPPISTSRKQLFKLHH